MPPVRVPVVVDSFLRSHQVEKFSSTDVDNAQGCSSGVDRSVYIALGERRCRPIDELTNLSKFIRGLRTTTGLTHTA